MTVKYKGIKIAVLLVLFCATTIQAQKYSIEAGYISPTRTQSIYGGRYPETFRGVRLGGNVEFDYKYNFSLLTGVLYSVVYSNSTQKMKIAGNNTDTIHTGIVKYSTFGHYVDVPVRVKYTLSIAKNLKLFAFAGPNINVGLGQPRKTDASLQESVTGIIDQLTGRVPVSGNDDLFRDALIHRINFQLGAGGGVQWKNYTIKGGYDFGINNLQRLDNAGSMRMNSWYVSFVYNF
ncbi:MAG: PorT family protein [Paludibacter sp.]|nr:PorT family protein [Paludibacter sp.]